jgi:hypothetical protein
VSDGRYVQDFGAGVAAHGLQILEHFFWDSYRLCPLQLLCSHAGIVEPPETDHLLTIWTLK